MWLAFQESEQQGGISQVILIGDAPAKDKSAIMRDRRDNGGAAYWDKTKYKTSTHYEAELDKLKRKVIPVFTLFLHAGAEENFKKIAQTTGGRCEYLDINCSKCAKLLTDYLTKEVVRKAAGSRGNDAVVWYENKVKKKSFIS